MKEATSELSGTIAVLLGVCILSGLFFRFVWPLMNDDMQTKATCSDAVCDSGYNENFMSWCYSPGDTSKTVFECPYRG